jgi:hypothetical protein
MATGGVRGGQGRSPGHAGPEEWGCQDGREIASLLRARGAGEAFRHFAGRALVAPPGAVTLGNGLGRWVTVPLRRRP